MMARSRHHDDFYLLLSTSIAVPHHRQTSPLLQQDSIPRRVAKTRPKVRSRYRYRSAVLFLCWGAVAAALAEHEGFQSRSIQEANWMSPAGHKAETKAKKGGARPTIDQESAHVLPLFFLMQLSFHTHLLYTPTHWPPTFDYSPLLGAIRGSRRSRSRRRDLLLGRLEGVLVGVGPPRDPEGVSLHVSGPVPLQVVRGCHP